MRKLEKEEIQPVVRENVEAKVLVPKVEALGKVGDFGKAKEHNVPDSVSSLHS